MAVINLGAFIGEIPKTDPEKLPDGAAEIAYNVRLSRGTLLPLRGTKRVAQTELVNPQTIFYYGAQWLSWANDVDVANAPVNNNKIYYTGDGAPKVRDGENIYLLGVPAPTGALTGTLNGSGTGDVDTRIYAYTWVTAAGEESPPSPASNEVNWRPGQTVTLSGFGTVPADRNITKQRIYRSQTSQGGTSYFFIAERNATTDTFLDEVPPSGFGEPLPSLYWDMPPTDLKGLISLPNGMMAGFVGRDVYFCEPYRPFAWPQRFALTTDQDIVGLGAYGNSIVVMTVGNPYVIVGTSPDTMIMEKTEINLPCLSKRGIVDLGYAVAYPTHDGIAVIGPNGANLITGSIFTKREWYKVNPASIVGGQIEGIYVASFQGLDLDGTLTYGAIMMDASGQTPFIVRTNVAADAYHYDIQTGRLYLALGRDILQWDSPEATRLTMEYKSKRYVYPLPVSFSAIRVDTDDVQSQEDIAAALEEQEQALIFNQSLFNALSVEGEINGGAFGLYTINGSKLAALPPPFQVKYALVTVYVEDEAVFQFSDLNEIVRLPAIKSRRWAIEVGGTTNIKQITMASSVSELAGVGA